MRKKRDIQEHTQLICSIGELSGLFTDAKTLESFLMKIVDMVAEHMHSEVCSIYLYNASAKELVLKATKGLNKEYINSVRLKLGEGLTGLAVKELRTICERNASKNMNFRFIPGLGEDKFESFLVVPISRGTTKVGAMVVQNLEKNYFTSSDISVLKAITSQLANTIETTRLILALEDKNGTSAVEEQTDLHLVKAKIGSSGLARGPLIKIGQKSRLRDSLNHIDSQHVFHKDDFMMAVSKTEKQLEQLQKEIEQTLSDVASLIFTAQLLMLKDRAFIDAILDLIDRGVWLPEAVVRVSEEYIQRFEQIKNSYLRQKSHDVADIARRLLGNITGHMSQWMDLENKIVIAEQLLPSDALKLSSQKVSGIILLSGGATSHLSILARSLHIPLVITEEPRLMLIEDGTQVLIDAQQGNIYINPQQSVVDAFEEKKVLEDEIDKVQDQIKPETFTKDKRRIKLYANINLLGDMENAKAYKSEGVGLYRTEFPFVVRNDFPSEEEQFTIYRKLIKAMPDKEITFRTLDIGGDKVLSYYEHHLQENNPYLGMRSIRFSLQNIDIFQQQIRAMLRAGVGSNLRIMFPMISSVDEFLTAKAIVKKSLKDLETEGQLFLKKPAIGMMVELPSVLEIIEELAHHADFFSIGTNDFIQYMLAVDRTNEKVSSLFLPQHPSVLRALKKVVGAAEKYHIDISLCGDMAHDKRFLPFLIGIGICKFSINPSYLPEIQNAVTQLDYKTCKKLAAKVMSMSSLNEINKYLEIEA